MSPIVKRRMNAGYHWLEQNPVTGILVSAFLSVAVTIAAVGALGLYSNSTYQQKTACAQDPAGRECAKQRLDVAKAEPLRNPCASFQRVTSQRGRNCKRFYVEPQGRVSKPQAAPNTGGRGGVRVPPAVADQPVSVPGEGGSDAPPLPGGGGNSDGPVPVNPSTPPAAVPSTPAVTAPPAQQTPVPSSPVTPAQPAPKAPAVVAPVVEGVRETVCNLTPVRPCELLPIPVGD